MSDFRRFPQSVKRQIIDYNRFLELTGTKILVCLDQGVLEIARYFLNSRAMWRSTYSVSYGEIGYTIPTESQMDIIYNAIAEANEDMSNCTQIAASLDAIANAINALVCGGGFGGGSGGAGQTAAAPSPVSTTPFDRTGPAPPGFATWAEYDTYACNMAHYIVNQLIGDIATAGVLAAGVSAATSLAPFLIGALFTPIPFDDLLIIAALGVEMAAIALSTSYIITALEAGFDDLVCSLLSGTSAPESLVAFTDNISAIIAADPTISGFGTLGVNIATDYTNSFVQYDSINRLFDKQAYEIPTGQVCDCGAPQLFQIVSAGYCPATLISGDFSDGGVPVIESCVSTVYGTLRSSINLQSTTSNVNERITLTDFAGNDGAITINYLDNGAGPFQDNYANFAAVEGQIYDCSGIHIIRGEPGNQDVFTLTGLCADI